MTTSVGEIATLAWGYTMADVDRLARRCASGTMSFGASMIPVVDRREDAWFGIVERLYSCMEHPAVPELLEAGRNAISRSLGAHEHHHGLKWTDAGYAPARNFTKYWNAAAGTHDDDFTDRVAERLALPQVLFLLTPREYEVLSVKAAAPDDATAIEVLGISRKNFYLHLRNARAKILEAWLAPETPLKKIAQGGDKCQSGHLYAEHGYFTTNKAGKEIRQCRICKRLTNRRSNRRDIASRLYEVDPPEPMSA